MQRIKEAEKNTKQYLLDGLITKRTSKIRQEIFYENAKDSIKAAQLLMNNEHTLWTIVTSYYSMFYIANTILLKKGYKVGDKIAHKVTSDALIAILRKDIQNSLINDYEEAKEEALRLAQIRTHEIITNYDNERKKRSRIQYETTEKEMKNKAKTSLNRAKEFLYELEKLL